MSLRIGQGFDIHSFETGKPLMLGGVHIPHDQGMKGHSDGDVVLHAICDALLGALALGDIGQHFSDQDPQFKMIDSRILLSRVHAMLKEAKYTVVNLDVTVLAEKPKLAPHISLMRETIAKDLQIAKSQVSIKATTMEKLDAIGQEKAIAAQAIVLVGVER